MPLPHMIDGVPYVLCQGCEALVVCTQQESLPDNGLILTLQGWYGGFTDNCFDKQPDSLLLCHDCAAKVFDAVPALAKRRGLHPSDNKRCCNYWWTVEGEQVIHGDGTMIQLEDGVLTQKALDNYRREQGIQE